MSIHHSKLIIRITILGSKLTGKTSIIQNYVGQMKNANELSLNDTTFSCDTVIEDSNVTQQILDSDGVNSAVTAWAHGVIIVFAVDNRESFMQAEKLIETTKQITMKNATIMLLANKIDLVNRNVLLEEGQRLAIKHNCNYKELSSQQNSMVGSVFYELSHEIIEKRGLMNKGLMSRLNHRTPIMVRRIFQAITQTAGYSASNALKVVLKVKVKKSR